MRPAAHPIHASLIRPRLYMGVERTVIAIEGTIVAALVFGVGLSLVTLGVVLVVWLLMHPVMAWVTSRDVQASEVFLRARPYADFYTTHAGIRRPHRRQRPSIPSAR